MQRYWRPNPKQCSYRSLRPLPRCPQHGSTQVVSLLAWHALPASERWQRVASILYACLPWLIPTVVPVRLLARARWWLAPAPAFALQVGW